MKIQWKVTYDYCKRPQQVWARNAEHTNNPWRVIAWARRDLTESFLLETARRVLSEA